MAYYLKKENALFLHVPKCAGHSVEKILEALGIECEQALPFDTACARHATLDFFPGEYDFVFCTVRHPASWLESFWRFHYGINLAFKADRWYPHEQLAHRMPEMFENFVAWVLDFEPGYVSRMFEWFCGPPGASRVNAVCRVESLATDLSEVLQHFGYDDVTPQRISAFPRDWVTTEMEHNAGRNKHADWNGLRHDFLRSERPAISRFYSTDFKVMQG